MTQRERRPEWTLLLGVLILYTAYSLRADLLLIFAAAMFSVILYPLVRRAQQIRIGKWHPGKGAAILLLLGFTVLVAGLVVGFAIPQISRDLSGFLANAPSILQNLQQKLSHLPFGTDLSRYLDAGSIQNAIASGAKPAFTVFQGVSRGVLAFVSLVVLTAYFILESEQVVHWAVSLFPAGQQARLQSTLDRAGARVQRWLSGQALLMLILGTSSGIVFGALGIRYYLLLAVFGGVANFVPILGPIATVLLASVVAVADSWTKLLGVLIFYAIYQQVENTFLTPRIMKSSVGLPATTVVVALMIGSSLAGVLGALLAVPTAALIATFVREYLIKEPQPIVELPAPEKPAPKPVPAGKAE